MEELIIFTKTDSTITILGEKIRKIWYFKMQYRGTTEKEIKTTKWNDVSIWLKNHNWTTYTIEKLNPLFEDRLRKLKNNGDKVQYNQAQRVVDLYKRLQQGERLYTEQLSFEYGKHKESIKEDIRNIRISADQYNEEIKYDKKEKCYYLVGETSELDIETTYILITFLNQSRCFTKEERKEIESKLLQKYSEEDRRALQKHFTSQD